ncbi:hypothetical protein SynBOUM118_00251 [Synechococcus sp. BOUM118]|nr:hypothetical protein SynBOUM118_00251 [Synechococcus sp. BOUM118]
MNVNKGREKGTGEAETLRHYLGLVDAGASADRVMQRLRATHNHQKNTNTKAMPVRHPAENASASAVTLVASEMQPIQGLVGVCS